MQLYTLITLVLGAQTIYYGHIYPQLKYRRQLKVQVPILYICWLSLLFSKVYLSLLEVSSWGMWTYVESKKKNNYINRSFSCKMIDDRKSLFPMCLVGLLLQLPVQMGIKMKAQVQNKTICNQVELGGIDQLIMDLNWTEAACVCSCGSRGKYRNKE